MTNQKLILTFCFGTSCFIRGAKELYAGVMDLVQDRGIAQEMDFRVSFCSERCQKGPVLIVGDTVLERCTLQMAADEIDKHLGLRSAPESGADSGGAYNA